MDWLRYTNQNATRRQPISDELIRAMSFLPELGVTMNVYSGGQPSSGPNRVGSTRHDHGNAADVMFYHGGRMLDWNNPGDIPVLADIVARAKAAGVTGIGAGNDYMGPGRMHIGFGSPAVWGAGGKRANAPQWLIDAYDNGQVSSSALAAINQAVNPGTPPARPSNLEINSTVDPFLSAYNQAVDQGIQASANNNPLNSFSNHIQQLLGLADDFGVVPHPRARPDDLDDPRNPGIPPSRPGGLNPGARNPGVPPARYGDAMAGGSYDFSKSPLGMMMSGNFDFSQTPIGSFFTSVFGGGSGGGGISFGNPFNHRTAAATPYFSDSPGMLRSTPVTTASHSRGYGTGYLNSNRDNSFDQTYHSGMNMDVYRANQEAIYQATGSRTMNQDTINEALSKGATLVKAR